MLKKNDLRTHTARRMIFREYDDKEDEKGDEQIKDFQLPECDISKPIKKGFDMKDSFSDFSVNHPGKEKDFFEKKNNYADEIYNLTFNDVVRSFKNSGIIGEEKLICSMVCAALSKMPFGVEGNSGSGKTLLANKMVSLLDKVYLAQQASPLAMYSNADEINKHDFLYVSEIQKALRDKKSPMYELFKDITEGRDSTRKVTNGHGILENRIKKDLTIIYTKATENYFKLDKELSRRFIRFATDSSKEQINRIHDFKAKKRYQLSQAQDQDQNLEEMIKSNFHNLLGKDIEVIDPFAGYFSSIIPKTQKSSAYVDHYNALVDGCAKFNYNFREKFKFDGKEYLLTNIEDHHIIFDIYAKDFINTLKDLADEGEKVTMPNPDWNLCFQKGYQVMKESPELEPMRYQNPHSYKRWHDSQIHQKGGYRVDIIKGTKIKIVETIPAIK